MGITVKLVTIVTGALATLLLTAATISPSDADSNAAAWLKVAGVESPPASLVSSTADYWLAAIGAVLLLVCIVGIFEWIFGETKVANKIKNWLRRNVWWRFGRSAPQTKSQSQPKMATPNRPNFEQEKQSQFDYPYPKAVLKLKLANPRGTRRGKPDGTPFAMSIAAQLQNDHTGDLENCSVVLQKFDGLQGGEDLSGLEFKLAKEGKVWKTSSITTQFPIIRRNMEDEVTPEPFLLLVGGREIPLEENSTYSLLLELRSEYRYSTLAKVQIDTGVGLDAEARFIGDQRVTEIDSA